MSDDEINQLFHLLAVAMLDGMERLPTNARRLVAHRQSMGDEIKAVLTVDPEPTLTGIIESDSGEWVELFQLGLRSQLLDDAPGGIH